MARLLNTSWKGSRVVPQHYTGLIAMIASARDFDDFKGKSAQGTVWADISRVDEIHNSHLDKEFNSMSQLANRRKPDLSARLAGGFGVPGCRPNPLIVSRRFSAAIEFLEGCLEKVRKGADAAPGGPKRSRGTPVQQRSICHFYFGKIFLPQEVMPKTDRPTGSTAGQFLRRASSSSDSAAVRAAW